MDTEPNTDNAKELAASFGSLVATLLFLGVGGCLWGGYVLMVLWEWFIVPLGVTPITFIWACALHMMGYWATTTGLQIALMKVLDNSLGSKFIRAYIVDLMALITGWVFHLFM